MQAGNMGGGDKEGGKKPSGRELQFSVCDVSSDDFKKTWLMLKELHEKELHHLQTKLANLKKEQLADGRWTGSIAKIKELTEQQKALNSTIHDLRKKLNAKICDRCSLNEAYRNTLQQEFYNIQQQNLRFINELTEERNRLREENEKLSAQLKLNLQQLPASFYEADDEEEFVPGTQRSVLAFSVREPAPGSQVHLPIRMMKQSDTEQMKTVQKGRPQRPMFSIPLYSQDLFEDPETSSEKLYSNSKSGTKSSANQKSPAGCPATSTLGPQSGYGSQDVSNLHKAQLGQLKRKPIFTQKTSTPKCETQIDFSRRLSSNSTTQNPITQVVPETPEEDMPRNNTRSFIAFTQSKEKSPLTAFPFDYTVTSNGKRRIKGGIPQYNTGSSVRDSSKHTPSIQQSTGKKNPNESTAVENDANKPLGDAQSSILGSAMKRKARIQTETGGK